MELTASHAIQGVMVLATIAGGYAVVKSNLSRVMDDLKNHVQRTDDFIAKFDTRLDDAESQRAIYKGQIETLKDINSVVALEKRNRELADVQARLRVMERDVDQLQKIHNGKHQPIT
jgi:cell division protein FtsX